MFRSDMVVLDLSIFFRSKGVPKGGPDGGNGGRGGHIILRGNGQLGHYCISQISQTYFRQRWHRRWWKQLYGFRWRGCDRRCTPGTIAADPWNRDKPFEITNEDEQKYSFQRKRWQGECLYFLPHQAPDYAQPGEGWWGILDRTWTQDSWWM